MVGGASHYMHHMWWVELPTTCITCGGWSFPLHHMWWVELPTASHVVGGASHASHVVGGASHYFSPLPHGLLHNSQFLPLLQPAERAREKSHKIFYQPGMHEALVLKLLFIFCACLFVYFIFTFKRVLCFIIAFLNDYSHEHNWKSAGSTSTGTSVMCSGIAQVLYS